MMETKEIYLDNAAMTPFDPGVREVMAPYLEDKFGNASSLYTRGRAAREAIEGSREKIADILNCKPYEIIFTSGGTESDNLAILGLARNKGKGHIITSKIEHHAVLNTCKQLEKEGFEVTYLPVDQEGLVSVQDVKSVIRPETILVSVMYANNEIGTIQPIAEIGEILRCAQNDSERRIYFHTDACQAAGYLDMDQENLGVDLMSFNGSKIYGPTGSGVLYKKKGVNLEPMLFGGGQESGLRPGTENVAVIVGLATALEIAQSEKDKENRRLEELREFLTRGLLQKIDKIRLNGHLSKRLPGNVNVSILNVEGEAMILMLDEKGIYVSTGSACTSNSLEPSHVLLALGLSEEAAHGSLRFSLGRFTDKYDLVQVLEVLPQIVEKLREMSPLRLTEKNFFKLQKGEI